MNFIYVLPIKLYLAQYLIILASWLLARCFGDFAGEALPVAISAACCIYFYMGDKNVLH